MMNQKIREEFVLISLKTKSQLPQLFQGQITEEAFVSTCQHAENNTSVKKRTQNL